MRFKTWIFLPSHSPLIARDWSRTRFAQRSSLDSRAMRIPTRLQTSLHSTLLALRGIMVGIHVTVNITVDLPWVPKVLGDLLGGSPFPLLQTMLSLLLFHTTPLCVSCPSRSDGEGGGGGGGPTLFSLYGYVPLNRVWFSES